MCSKIDYNKDIDSIKEIWKKYHKKESCKKLIEEVECSRNETYINEKDGEVKAFLTIRNKNVQDDKTNYIFEFYAVEIRKGYGRKLLEKMQDEREFLVLHVKKTNSDVVKRYEKYGFQINGKNQDGSKYCMVWRKSVKRSDGLKGGGIVLG